MEVADAEASGIAHLSTATPQQMIVECGGIAIIGENNNVNFYGQQRLDEKDEHERIIKLPQKHAPFVGREDILNTLKYDVETSQFIVIHGGPCLGKSALSVNFAHEVKEAFKCIIWIDMREVTFNSELDKVFQKLCAMILSELNVDISDIKEDERSVQLGRRFRSYARQNQKTLIILDNADEFVSSDKLHSDRSKALKDLLMMISKNAENHVKIVASSREKANEISFPKVKNINLLKLSEEDSNIFLERTLDKSKMKHMVLLVEKCRGVPYILRILALALNEIIDEDEETGFVTCVQEAPFEAAEENYSYINELFDISFQSLLRDEVNVAKALSIFPASFSFYLAKKLCDKLGMVVGRAAPSIKRLRDKGIIDKFDENGESLHPFMKEYIQKKKCSSNENRKYQAALITVYIDYLFKISQDSFNNEGGTDCILKFRRNGSILQNLISLLKLETPSKGDAAKVGKTLERDFPEYFLLLRFLYYLVNEEEIDQLFTAFSKFVDGSVSHTIKLCLDELRWEGGEGYYRDGYEFVMIERRLLSKQLNQNRPKSTRHQPDDTFRERLEALLEKCKILPDAKVGAYYMMKTNKLLGQYYKEIRSTEKSCEYFSESLKISSENFGDGFFTVDCYERYAVSLQSAGKVDEAGESFKEAYEIAKRSKILLEQKLSNMLVSWGSFLLNCTAEKEEGLKLLEQACRLQEKAGYFEKVIPKVMIAFCTHDLVKFKSEYTRLHNAGFSSVERIQQFHLYLAECLLYSGREEKDTEKSEEGFRLLQEAFESCCKAIPRERADNVKRIVLVLTKFIKYDLSEFKKAYLKLQKSGFISSERMLDFLLPLADFLLFGGDKEDYAEQNEEGFRILQEALKLCCKNNPREKVEIVKEMVPILKKLIKFNLTKFKNTYIMLKKYGFVSSEKVSEFLVPVAEGLLFHGRKEQDNEKSEEGFRILQEAFDLCETDITSQAAKNYKPMVDVLNIFMKFDHSKFKNAYINLQKNGFFSSEGVLDFLVPLADRLLYSGKKEQDNEKSEEGFRILQRAFELCNSENQQQIYSVLNFASRYDVSKLIEYMQKYKFNASDTSSEDFYKCVKFHSFPTKTVDDRAFEWAWVEQEFIKRMQFAKIVIEIMSGVDLTMASIEERRNHFRNLCHFNKVCATESTHILTEDERRPFAKECLRLKELHDILLNDRNLQDLNHIIDAQTSQKDQEYYKRICFLLEVRDHMVKSGLEEQLKQNLQQLKQHPWSKEPEIENKLNICSLAIPSVRESEEGLILLEKLVVYVEKPRYLLKGDLYYLNLLMPKFVESAAEKQRSVAKQLCVRVLQLLERHKERTQFEDYREQFHGLAYG